MTKTFTWTSEPGLILEGSYFKTTHETITDAEGNYVTVTSNWGNPCGSCAWYFVPPKEKVRLEAEGAIFEEALK